MSLSTKIGVRCLALSALLWAVSLPLHIAGQAAHVGSANFILGGLFGLCLACVTRTRRPILIYVWLALACLALWPLFVGWPLLDSFDLPSERAWHYLALLRVCLFVLGLPYTFALIGQHVPDPLPQSLQSGSTLAEPSEISESADIEA